MPNNVQFVTNAGSLALRKRILAGKTGKEFRKAAELYAVEEKRCAFLLSSGPLKSKSLGKMGHPYRLLLPPGSAGLPDYIINVQSGDFRGGWRVRVTQSGRSWLVTLYNVSPHAKYMMGTDKMRERLIAEQVQRMIKPQWPKAVRAITRKASQANGGNAPFTGSFWGGVAYAVGVGAASAAGGLESAL